MITAHIIVTPKRSVLDPQGETVKKALFSLGLEKVKGVRVGKFIELELDDVPNPALKAKLAAISLELLSNPVIEDYEIKIEKPAVVPPRADYESLPDPSEESTDDLIQLEARPKKAIKKLAKVEKKATKEGSKKKKKADKEKGHKKEKEKKDSSEARSKKKK